MNGKDVQIILGSSIRELRISRGISQEKLAELIDKQTNTINRIETGVNFVKSDTLAEIANVLNVHPSVLFLSRPQVFLEEKKDAMRAIMQILQTFTPEKLQEVYNILRAMNNK